MTFRRRAALRGSADLYACFVHRTKGVAPANWVRNRREGAVEVLAQGPPDRLERFEQRLRQGPSTARVDAVQPQPAPPNFSPSGEFIVKEDL